MQRVHYGGETYCWPAVMHPYCRSYANLGPNERITCAGKVPRSFQGLRLSQKHCWKGQPAIDRNSDSFHGSDSGTPHIVFPFANGGLYGGEASAVARALERYKSLLIDPNRPGAGLSDQPVFHYMLGLQAQLSNSTATADVDRHASLFLNMCCPKYGLEGVAGAGPRVLWNSTDASGLPILSVHGVRRLPRLPP